jgi:hypothetical protein
MGSLEAVLNENGLGQWFATLDAEEISLANIMDVTSEDLKEAGLPIGARRNILKLFTTATPHPPDGLARSHPSPRRRSHGVQAEVVEWDKRVSGKKFGCFLSHHKDSCAMEARFLKTELQGLIQKECFLDSDNLRDLRHLLGSVRDSDVLVIVQSAEILTRPWCLLEMVAAVDAGVPMIAISVSGKGYNFADAAKLLTHLDTELDAINPGACDLLRQNGVEPLDAAFKLSTAVPNMISLPFDSGASSNAIQAALLDIVAAMNTVKPMAQPTDRQEWVKGRAKFAAKPVAAYEHGVSSAPAALAPAPTAAAGFAAAAAPAPVPPTVPEQPEVMAERPEMLAEMRYFLLGGERSAGTVALSSVKKSKVAAHGQGGVGKTTMASAAVRDSAVRNGFARIAWVSVGQTPAVMELQRVLFNQLTGIVMPVEEGATAGTQLGALQAVCSGQCWLVVLDDVWEKAHEKQLSCVDAASASKLLVTTRIR